MAKETNTAPIIILGAGHAGMSVGVNLRARGHQGRILLIEADTALPYERPPLSKEMLKPGGSPEPVAIRREQYLNDKGLELVRGARAVGINREASAVELSDGTRQPYSRLVIATGSSPRRLTLPGADLPGILMLKTLADARALRESLRPWQQVVVIGAGYIGLEVAAAASALGATVTVLEFQDRIMSRVTSEPVSRHFESVHREHGVRFAFGAGVASFEGTDRVTHVVASDDTRYPADLVVAGIGVIPNESLAIDAGLECADGILVDHSCRTSDPLILAAGDVTRFAAQFDGVSQRLECLQNAQAQADRVAAEITGQQPADPEVPWFWTVQHGVRLQTAGVRNPEDRVVVRGNPQDGKFSVAYLREGRLAALDSIGGLSDFRAAKKLIADRALIDPTLLADPNLPLADSALVAAAA
ncbi:NAD(P)/FAD-dependent oxidoreductase [Paeniglutamicibacter sp.]|uniref:NAD(P)/FAD-dependent oxidoreductase n=1 Tax=Paeniglutamicibacter sp. TaxID=1934391 RepID=UPI0039898E18